MVASVDPRDEEAERVIHLMNDLARPFFILRAADGLLRANARQDTKEAASQSLGARKRLHRATEEVIKLIDEYVREE